MDLWCEILKNTENTILWIKTIILSLKIILKRNSKKKHRFRKDIFSEKPHTKDILQNII